MQKYYFPPKRRHNKAKLAKIVAVLIVSILPVYLFFTKTNPPISAEVLAIKPTLSSNNNVALPWPIYGQSAVGAKGYGILATSQPEQKPVPIASLAKVMTALAILKQHPLSTGEQGPDITITEEDIESFNEYSFKNGAVTKVVLGQKITQYQAMQAMLIRSANNMADTLARWSYGSKENFLTAVNNYARELGLTNTHLDDASGFSPQTVSTARDMVLLGEHALNNPVISEIVATWQVELPEVGLITNSNYFLDYEDNGVIGIKTGHTEEAGGTYLTAAKYNLDNNQTVIVIAAVLGALTHFTAQKDVMPLLVATRDNFKFTTIVSQNQVVGRYILPWGNSINATALDKVTGLSWGQQMLEPNIDLKPLSLPIGHKSKVGSISIETSPDIIPVVIADQIGAPSLPWRIKYFLGNALNNL